MRPPTLASRTRLPPSPSPAAPAPVPRREDDALKHLGQLPDVEQVVELGGRRQHLGLRLVPERHRQRHEARRDVGDLRCKHVAAEAALDEAAEDRVDRRDGRERDVEHPKLALQPVGDVVLAAAWCWCFLDEGGYCLFH